LYQHIENKYELLPKIYDVIKKHRTPVFIQTKSTLILRDFELIKEIANITTVDIATSISSFDESICKVMELGASSALERIGMLSKFSGICRSTTLGFMPIIPLLSDADENLETVFRLAKEYGIDYVVSSFLFLRGEIKPKFFALIKLHFPEIYPEFSKLYPTVTVNKTYEQKINLEIEKLRQKYNLFGIYEPIVKQEKSIQLSFFENF
jgi:DNA repair photolyase